YCDANSLALLGESAGAALIIEQEQGDPDAWIDRLGDAGALLDRSWFGTQAAERERFRRFRHALPERVNDTLRRRGFQNIGSDYAVPIARNREMMSFYEASLGTLDHVIFGHIGDAHVHVNILPNNEAERDAGTALLIEFAKHAVALGGTVSAEHGLGKRKRHL